MRFLLDTHTFLWAASHKTRLSPVADVFVTKHLRYLQVALLPIDLSHLRIVSTMPLYHRDPFDRLIVAQSLVETAPLVSADATLDAYAATRLW